MFFPGFLLANPYLLQPSVALRIFRLKHEAQSQQQAAVGVAGGWEGGSVCLLQFFLFLNMFFNDYCRKAE